jgi:hypothetical protein
VEVIARRRRQHGYQTVAETRVPILHASAA